MSQLNSNLSSVGTEDGDYEAPQPQAAPAETMDQKVARLELDLEQTKQRVPAMNQVLGDPQVAELMAARASGQRVKIVPDVPAPEVEEKEEVIDWATMSPELIPGKVIELGDKRAQKIANKIINERLGPVQQQTQQMQQIFTRQQEQEAVKDVNALRAKYGEDEIKKYAPAMSQLHQESGGKWSPEKLYLLARALDGKPAPVEERRGTESERPNTSAARPPSRATSREQDIPPGRGGYQAALDRVLSRVKPPVFA
jgi:hypothetical protein